MRAHAAGVFRAPAPTSHSCPRQIFGSRVKVDSLTKVAEIEAAEKEKMRDKCRKIIDHGVTCFINRQLIYNYPEQLFAEAGVMAIEHADFVGVERLAAVIGGECRSRQQ
jgi:T-complex protein 1 subunit beta